MFCDELNIKVIAGKGGDGCSSFRREKFVPKGGPDGGDGGRGGDLIIKVNPHLNTLGHLANKKIYKAPKGVNGRRKNQFGANGNDLEVEVPPGTIIFNADKSEMLADLNKVGEQVMIVQGGKGGLGNARFASSTHQAPRFAENGEPGEERDIVLELKLVADLGIIGLPSAGKSTLISVISNARPKIAAYHFTTLIPNLGVVSMAKFGGSANDTFVVADIPGLIEGASEGKGLGHQFLKHVSRTKLHVHLIDISQPNIKEDYTTIRNELKEFNKEVAKKPEIIVLNKIDMLQEDEIKEKIKEIKTVAKKAKIFTISAITHENLKTLIFEIVKRLQEIKESEKVVKKVYKKDVPVMQPHLTIEKFRIQTLIKNKDCTIFPITGKRIEQLAVMTDTNALKGLKEFTTSWTEWASKKQLKRLEQNLVI